MDGGNGYRGNMNVLNGTELYFMINLVNSVMCILLHFFNWLKKN